MKSEGFISNPNQREVEIVGKDDIKKKSFLGTTFDSISYAIQDLSPREFQVWLYFSGNAPGYKFWFSPAELQQEWGIKKDTTQKAVQVLIQKGYLVQKEGKKNSYEFYEIPPEALELIEIEKVDIYATERV